MTNLVFCLTHLHLLDGLGALLLATAEQVHVGTHPVDTNVEAQEIYPLSISLDYQHFKEKLCACVLLYRGSLSSYLASRSAAALPIPAFPPATSTACQEDTIGSLLTPHMPFFTAYCWIGKRRRDVSCPSLLDVKIVTLPCRSYPRRGLWG